MSRGPGRWQRDLLHAVYENPTVAPNGRRHVHVRSWLRRTLDREPTPAEFSAAHRAARLLVASGKARSRNHGFVGDLEPLDIA